MPTTADSAPDVNTVPDTSSHKTCRREHKQEINDLLRGLEDRRCVYEPDGCSYKIGLDWTDVDGGPAEARFIESESDQTQTTTLLRAEKESVFSARWHTEEKLVTAAIITAEKVAVDEGCVLVTYEQEGIVRQAKLSVGQSVIIKSDVLHRIEFLCSATIKIVWTPALPRIGNHVYITPRAPDETESLLTVSSTD